MHVPSPVKLHSNRNRATCATLWWPRCTVFPLVPGPGRWQSYPLTSLRRCTARAQPLGCAIAQALGLSFCLSCAVSGLGLARGQRQNCHQARIGAGFKARAAMSWWSWLISWARRSSSISSESILACITSCKPSMWAACGLPRSFGPILISRRSGAVACSGSPGSPISTSHLNPPGAGTCLPGISPDLTFLRTTSWLMPSVRLASEMLRLAIGWAPSMLVTRCYRLSLRQQRHPGLCSAYAGLGTL